MGHGFCELKDGCEGHENAWEARESDKKKRESVEFAAEQGVERVRET
jgi:hypothetical protein